jgi:hypothetical protein
MAIMTRPWGRWSSRHRSVESTPSRRPDDTRADNRMAMLRTVTATRYITPLREGGSLPAVVEGDDDGLYVLKFRGAGQGRKALIAELLAGELARAVGLPVPEIVFMQLDAELARTEPDAEIQDLIRASVGLNLALDYLPGSVAYDPLVHRIDAELASAIVWHDAFTTNVDRTPRNVNLLMWHRRLWLIDHGAALIFHHQWDGFLERSNSAFPMVKDHLERSNSAFPMVKDHVLLGLASRIAQADARIAPQLSVDIIKRIVDEVPDDWLEDTPHFTSLHAQRDAYRSHLMARLRPPRAFVEEAIRAHAVHI